jgi:NhaP-type Na+/H+ and K+/H+ antiporter
MKTGRFSYVALLLSGECKIINEIFSNIQGFMELFQMYAFIILSLAPQPSLSLGLLHKSG